MILFAVCAFAWSDIHAEQSVAPPATAATSSTPDLEIIPWAALDAEPIASYETYAACKASLGNCSGGCERCGRSVYPDCCKTGNGTYVWCGAPRECDCPKACQ